MEIIIKKKKKTLYTKYKRPHKVFKGLYLKTTALADGTTKSIYLN